jgi:transcriptional regulator with XRE-family HTH domain
MSVAVRQMMADTRIRADGSKLKAARDAKRWSQEDLARAAGYALSSIQKLEQGTYFSLRCLECCAEALEIPVADLMKEGAISTVLNSARPPENLDTSLHEASESVVVTSPVTCGDRCCRLLRDRESYFVDVTSIERAERYWKVAGRGKIQQKCHCPLCGKVYSAIVYSIPIVCAPYPCPSCEESGTMVCTVESIQVSEEVFQFHALLVCKKCRDYSIVESEKCNIDSAQRITLSPSEIKVDES